MSTVLSHRPVAKRNRLSRLVGCPDDLYFSCEIADYDCDFRVYYRLDVCLDIALVELVSIDGEQPTAGQRERFEAELALDFDEKGDHFRDLQDVVACL